MRAPLLDLNPGAQIIEKIFETVVFATSLLPLPPAGETLPRTCPPLCRLAVETSKSGRCTHVSNRVLEKGRQRTRVAVAHDGREYQRIGADVGDDSVTRRQQDRESRHCPGAYYSSSSVGISVLLSRRLTPA